MIISHTDIDVARLPAQVKGKTLHIDLSNGSPQIKFDNWFPTEVLWKEPKGLS